MTNSDAPEAKESKKARATPGASFPIVSLAEAIEYVTEAGKYGMEHSRDAFAGYTKSKTAGSGRFKQKLGALRHFGLITTKGDRVILTELAKALAHPTDPAQTDTLTRQAFDHCRIFSLMYDRLSKGISLDLTIIGNSAVTNLKVSPLEKAAFAKSFIESAVAAGLAERTDADKVRLSTQTTIPASDEAPSPPDTQTTDGQPAIPERPTRPRRQQDDGGGWRVVLSQVWPIATGEIALEVRTANALPATAFTDLTAIITSLEQLAGRLQGHSDDNTSDN